MTDGQAFAEISGRSAAELAKKYLALWNEPDVERRRRMIAELWTQDGRHLLQPPQEIRAIAARPGIGLTAILEARGHEEIEARAASAYEHWVGSEGLSFRGRDDAERLGDVVKFHWEAVDKDGEAFGVGLNFLAPRAAGSSATSRHSASTRFTSSMDRSNLIRGKAQRMLREECLTASTPLRDRGFSSCGAGSGRSVPDATGRRRR
jgi:hypothetical protein